MKLFILTIIFVALAILLLCVGVIFRKDHSFRSQHIHENERMKADNIHCAAAQDQPKPTKREPKPTNTTQSRDK